MLVVFVYKFRFDFFEGFIKSIFNMSILVFLNNGCFYLVIYFEVFFNNVFLSV